MFAEGELTVFLGKFRERLSYLILFHLTKCRSLSPLFPRYHDEEVHLESLVEFEFHFPIGGMFKWEFRYNLKLFWGTQGILLVIQEHIKSYIPYFLGPNIQNWKHNQFSKLGSYRPVF